MPITGLNVGRDCTFQVYDPNTGGIIDFANITMFDAKPDVTDLKHKALDGLVLHGNQPDSWSGSFTLDRASSAADQFISLLETAYYNGQNIDNGTITQTIQEANGSITQWRFTNVSLKMDDAGSWANDKFISQKFSWHASRRIQIQ